MTLLEAALRNLTEKKRQIQESVPRSDRYVGTYSRLKTCVFTCHVQSTVGVLRVWESTREKFSRIVPMPNWSVREPPGKRHSISAPSQESSVTDHLLAVIFC